jgi:hypothetical protein
LDKDIHFLRRGVDRFDVDPPIARIVDPIRRIEVDRDKGVRLICVRDGTRVAATGEHDQAAVIVRLGFAQVDLRGICRRGAPGVRGRR